MAGSGEVSREEILSWLVKRVSAILIISEDDIDCTTPLNELGMDSQESLGLIGELEDWIECPIPVDMEEEFGSLITLTDSAMAALANTKESIA